MHQGRRSPGVFRDEDRRQAEVVQLLRSSLKFHVLHYYHPRHSVLSKWKDPPSTSYRLPGPRRRMHSSLSDRCCICLKSILDHG